MTTIDFAAKRAEANAIADRRGDIIRRGDDRTAAAKAAHPSNVSRTCPPHAGLLHRLAATITAEDLPPARITISVGAVEIDLTGSELVENGVRRYAAGVGSPVTETPYDVQGFAATRWSASGWLDGNWWSISGTELLPCTGCSTCDRPVGEWPAKDCETPEEHPGVTRDCDCGETVTVEQAIADPSRHRRCAQIGAST